METILFALSPVVVALLTSGVKKVVPILAQSGKTNLRLVVAVLAIATTVFQASLSGDVNGIDASAIEIASVAIVNFLGASGVWLFKKEVVG